MLVGRSRELTTVTRAVADGGLVVLVGPAGIGKTSLGRAALESLGPYREGGALATLAWSPLVAIRRLLRAAPPDEPDAVAAAVLGQGTTPLLLDDLQWSDDATLAVVAELVGRLPMVVTVREGAERSAEVVAALELVGGRRVDLAGLEPRDADDLARRLHPDLAPSARAALLAAAEGNPLLLGELPQGDEASPTLVSALLGRLDRLDPSARAAFELLAVLGRPAGPEVLGDGAAELVPAGLAIPADDASPGAVAIHHSLLAEVVVDRLGPRADDRRRELAPRVPPAEGAHLLETAGDRAGARALALEALEALEGSASRRGARLLALAVRCAPDGDLDVDRRMEVVRLLTALSEPAAARELAAPPGRDDLPPAQRGALVAAEAEAAWVQGRHEESAELSARALADLRGTDTEAEVLTLAGSTVVHTYLALDGRPALDQAREAVALADRIGKGQGYARSRLASVLVTAGEDGWAELYEQVQAMAEADDDEELRRTATVSLVLGHWASGAAVAGEAVARREVERGPRGTYDVRWLTFVAYAAVLGLLVGRPRDELVAMGRPHLERWPVFRARPFLEAAVVLALADQGRHGDAADLARGAVGRAGQERQWRSIAWWAEADRCWQAGDGDGVLEAAEATLSLGVGDYPSALQARLVAAHVAREQGIAAPGPAPASSLPAWASAAIEWAALERSAAGDDAGAVDDLLEAADRWGDSDVRSQARCRWAAGDLAHRIGRADAVELLDAAEGVAERTGQRALAERVRRSLRAAGVARRASSEPGIAGLTGREVEVLDLVGAGLRSAEIAAALGLAPSTVDSLVRSAVRTLGVGTRVAAAARLRQLRDEA